MRVGRLIVDDGEERSGEAAFQIRQRGDDALGGVDLVGADRLLHREEEVGLAIDVRVDALRCIGVEHLGDIADAGAVAARDLDVGDGSGTGDVAADVDTGLALLAIEDAAWQADVVHRDRANHVVDREVVVFEGFGVDLDLDGRRDDAIGLHVADAGQLLDGGDEAVLDDRR